MGFMNMLAAMFQGILCVHGLKQKKQNKGRQ
jgi:hypothetical protein